MSESFCVSASALRREISARQQARGGEFEQTSSRDPSVIHVQAEDGSHGNFLAASYRRIVADESWKRRMNKRYTADAHVPRAQDRWRGELECANSSDALLMNLFCYPRVLHRPQVCALLGIASGRRPEFGVRAGIAMKRDEVDRTELDMCIGDLAVEAKLTESGFGVAARERVMRYEALADVFDVEALPWGPRGLAGYQLVRGVLAAEQTGRRFLLLCDGRRGDLQEVWFRVLRAVQSCELRSRMAVLSWQELAAVMPQPVQRFLLEKYGIGLRFTSIRATTIPSGRFSIGS